MIKNYFYLIFLLFLTLTTSCSIKGSFQGLYSYYNKTTSNYPNLLIKPNSTDSICDFNYSQNLKVLLINGQDFKNCIQNYEESIIFLWRPKCVGKYCYSLNLLQGHFDKENIELFIVAEYYDGELMKDYYTIKRPIYGIDTEFYNTNLTYNYLSRFLSDLNIEREDVTNNFLYFKNGIFINSFKEIELDR